MSKVAMKRVRRVHACGFKAETVALVRTGGRNAEHDSALSILEPSVRWGRGPTTTDSRWTDQSLELRRAKQFLIWSSDVACQRPHELVIGNEDVDERK